MNKRRLKSLVRALQHLPPSVRSKVVETLARETEWQTENHHDALIVMIAPVLPLFQRIYMELLVDPDVFNHDLSRKALDRYLCLKPMQPLPAWAADNKHLWGNEHGYSMFYDNNAFNDKRGKLPLVMNYQYLIDHWQGVCDRVCR